MPKSPPSVFDNFTNLYSLNKTLRFELKPIWNTQKMLDDERCPIVEHDRVRREKYELTKPWLDQLHREFINDALRDFRLKELTTYLSDLQAWQRDKKSKRCKDALAKAESKLRQEIVDRFEKNANEWISSDKYKFLGLKKDGIGILFEAGVFKILKERFKEEKDTTTEQNIFDEWDKWTGYFKKFFETRKNYYKSDDTSTAVAHRAINQNLRRFCENIQIFKAIQDRIDFSEVENNFNISCADVLSLEHYNGCLLQKGIDEYNKIIGGELRGSDKKIRGINELINKYRQDHREEKMPFLKMLDKQIHSEKEPFIESIGTDSELRDKLEVFYKNASEKVEIIEKLIANFTLDYISYDLNKIYLSKDALARNASRWFADYNLFERDLFAIVSEKQNKNEYELLRTHKEDSKISDKDGKISFPDFIKCLHIQQALEKQEGKIWKEKYYEDIPEIEKTDRAFGQFLHVLQFELEQQFLRKTVETTTGRQREVGYDIFETPIKAIIAEKDRAIDQNAKIDIRNYADTVLSIYQIAKYFAVEKRRGWLDNYDLDDRFYKSPNSGYLSFYHEAFEQIIRPYNLFRNYLTKKPYGTNKWVLNFENPTLADGWDKNKEKENSAIILEKNGCVMLGVMRKDHGDLFTDKVVEVSKYSSENVYRKMVYKYFPNPSQMIPKCSTQLKAVKDHFETRKQDEAFCLSDKKNFVKPLLISKQIYELNNFEYQKSYLQQIANKGTLDKSRRVKADIKKASQVKLFQKEFFELSRNKIIYKQALTTWIDFCKSFLATYRSTATSDFDYSHIKETSEYDSIDQFYRDVERGSYKITWELIPVSYLQKKNRENELFIFEIHNKDWNLKDGRIKTGAKNLHTLYFEQLFSEENKQNNFPFKLNGEAELFFRPKTKEEQLGYKIWDPRGKKWIKVGKKAVGTIVDRKRYAEDSLLFHCPITLNRVSENKTKFDIDSNIRKVIADDRDVRIIGIDRGEKHLIYYSVIDQNGKIIATDSLNAIGKDGQGKPVEYAKKLGDRAKNRDEARREWKDIEEIKDLRMGYLSQVVHKIANLAIEQNAFIVLEDLNMRFKQIRGGIEKSVYQQLEKTLIEKLSFLVKKSESDSSQAGHVLRAYQLAAPVNAFKDMGKQTGIVFYTQAGYTSKTCPSCGFRRNAKFQFENISQAVNQITSLELFKYNPERDAFLISYSLKKMLNKDHSESNKPKNELYAETSRKDVFTLTTENALRHKWYDRYSAKAKVQAQGIEEYKGEAQESETKKGVIKTFNVTEYIKGLLESVRIDYVDGDIKKQISSGGFSKTFYQDLLFAFFLLSETRDTISGSGIDYIHCPECGFDSRKGFQGKKFNGDANGAYNIARKGLIILDKIRQFRKKEDVSKMGWGDMSIGITEWDKFVSAGLEHTKQKDEPAPAKPQPHLAK